MILAWRGLGSPLEQPNATDQLVEDDDASSDMFGVGVLSESDGREHVVHPIPELADGVQIGEDVVVRRWPLRFQVGVLDRDFDLMHGLHLHVRLRVQEEGDEKEEDEWKTQQLLATLHDRHEVGLEYGQTDLDGASATVGVKVRRRLRFIVLLLDWPTSPSTG